MAFCLRAVSARPFLRDVARPHWGGNAAHSHVFQTGKSMLKLLPSLALTGLCALAYTGTARAEDETPSDTRVASVDPTVSGILPAETSHAEHKEAAAAADTTTPAEAAPVEKGRDAKNAIYLDLLGPGVLYSINYDRMLTDTVSARIGFSYLSFGASASDGTSTASASLSYMAIPITASYLGIGSENNMLELGGGVSIMNFKGSGVIKSSDDKVQGGASTTTVAMTGIIGYRHQPSDGGFVFRAGLSPMEVFGGNFLPWGYLSLGAAF
jgi:hypothetical protein